VRAPHRAGIIVFRSGTRPGVASLVFLFRADGRAGRPVVFGSPQGAGN